MRMPTKFHLDDGAIVFVGKFYPKNRMYRIVGIHGKSKVRKQSKLIGIGIHKDNRSRNEVRWKNGSFN